MPVDVQALDCDFYVATGHKLYGPTGIGVLYGKRGAARGDAAVHGRRRHDPLASRSRGRTWNDLPYKFEAGTPNIAGAIGLRRGARLHRGRSASTAIAAHERDLLDVRHARCCEAIPGVRLIGTAREKASILSFVMEGVHPHDIGTIVDREGVAIRTGHHCAQPVMERFGIPATARASLAMYNTRGRTLDALARALREGARGIRLMSDLSDLTRRSSSTTTGGRGTSACSRRRATRRGLQPAVRRSADAVLQVDGDVITDVAFQGSGCAISKASASLMTDAIKGRTGRGGARAVRAVSPDGDDAARAGRSRTSGKLSVAGRRARVPGAREVREPGVAHAQGGARRAKREDVDRIGEAMKLAHDSADPPPDARRRPTRPPRSSPIRRRPRR